MILYTGKMKTEVIEKANYIVIRHLHNKVYSLQSYVIPHF